MMTDKTPRRALIIQPGAVGDSILTLPLVRMLAGQAGMTQIDMMGRCDVLSLFLGRTPVDNVLSLDGAGLHVLFADSSDFHLPDGHPLIDLLGRYEMVVTFLGDAQGHFERNLLYTIYARRAAEVVHAKLHPDLDWPGHVAEFFLRQVIDEIPHAKLEIGDDLMAAPLIELSELDIAAGRQILARAGLAVAPEQVVAIHPGSGGLHKCWPLNNFHALARRLCQAGRRVVWLVGPAEQDRWPAEDIQSLQGTGTLVHNLSLEEIASVLACCGLYVGNDSGISHLAGALGGSGVAIFYRQDDIRHCSKSNCGSSRLSLARHWRPLGRGVLACEWRQSPGWPTVDDVFDALACRFDESPGGPSGQCRDVVR